MSSATPPGKPPAKAAKGGAPKPFLGDDDLSELDAWVETFDALHMGDEAAPGAAEAAPDFGLEAAPDLGGAGDAGDAGDELPGGDATELVRLPPEPGETSQFSTRDLDETLALDSDQVEAVLAAEPPSDPRATRNLAEEVDLAIAHAAEPDDEDDAVATSAPVRKRATTVLGEHHAPPVEATAGHDDPHETDFSSIGDLPTGLADADDDAFGPDDDEVFTSASRPGPAAPDDAAFEDALVPPPTPEIRRSPAIVRRAPIPVIEEPNPGDSDSMFSEQTRVADFTELERRVFSSRQSQPAVVTSAEDEDDYADLEVSDDKSADDAASAPDAPAPEVYATSRRTAHVLRRGEATTRPPMNVPIGTPAVADLDGDRDAARDLGARRPATRPGGEDDFSDVAAAVGAGTDDDGLAESARRIGSRSGLLPAAPAPAFESPRTTVDDALATFPDDDSAFDDPNQFEDSLPFADPHEFDEPPRFDARFVAPASSDAFAAAEPTPLPVRPGSQGAGVAAYPPPAAPESFDDSHAFDDPDAFDEPQFAPQQFDPSHFDDTPDPDVGFDDAGSQAAAPTVHDAPRDLYGLAPLDMPIPGLPPKSAPRTSPPPFRKPESTGEAERPAPSGGLADLYPRIKTPTSVPPIGGKPSASQSMRSTPDVPTQGSQAGALPRSGSQSGPLPTQSNQSTSQSGQLPTQSSQSGLLPRQGSQSGPLPTQTNQTSQAGALPRQGSQSGPLPTPGSQSGLLPRQGSQSGPLPTQGSQSGPLPRSGSQSGPLPRALSPSGSQPGQGSQASALPRPSTQGSQVTALPAQPPRPTRLATPISFDPSTVVDVEPALDLETVARSWPEQVAPLPTATLDEASAQALLVYERELATVDDSAASAALRIEAGRLCERLTDFERARGHYDAALMSDPRATPALRGLRRLARTAGDLAEAIRHLDAEISVAGALERRPLAHYRVDLMMASNEQDLARVAAGELLDQAPSDVRALLAQLELAFLDGRADEFGVALEQLAQAVSDTELRAALQSARGALAAHHNDTGAAASWFAAAAESDPTALAALLGAIRQATGANQSDAAARALVDLARQVEATDPITAAAAAVRAQQWAEGELGQTAAVLAATAAPSDPLVARLAAHNLDAAADPIGAANAYIHWAHNAGSNAERGYAAARAAELDPARGTELWASAIALDPGDDYAAAQLRTSHVAADETQAAIDVDLEIAGDDARDRARLRAAYGMIAQGQLEAAIDVLQQGRAARPGSIALSEALGEALAAAGKWTERAKLFAELADEPGEQLDREVAQLRSALAWEEAVGAAANTEAEGADSASESAAEHRRASVVTTTAAALDAWERVLERGSSPSAHAAAIVLASRLGDHGLIGEALVRAQTAERMPLAAASIALRRARLAAADDPQRHESILRDLPSTTDDPRRTLGLILGAARRKELGDAAAALDERASLLEAKGADTEVAALRLRAAQLALDAGEAAKATALLLKVEPALPQLGVVPDLLAAARRRAGDRPALRATRRSEPVATGAASADAFARVVRDADLAVAQGDAAAALGLYQRALEIRPGDALAAVPLIRVATQLREPAPIAALALAQLRLAEEAGDDIAKATAYELLAQIDDELRGDPGSAQMALESAAQADPSRLDLLHRLERQYAVAEQPSELLRLRTVELETLPAELGRDRSALLIDLAGITQRDGRPELELADLYRRVLAIDPKNRLALLHLEAIVRRSGFSPELATLEENIATYFESDAEGAGDAKAQAAFWTRAGETLAELGRIDEAVQRFGKADAAFPGHVPALEGWRQAALKGQLWIDVAEAATRQAAGVEGKARATLHHFAGVALMDKALVGDRAMTSFRRALEAEPGHRDAFLRLRILLEEDAHHDDLATLLALRLEVETDAVARIGLHRALAELHRNFLSDRDTAKGHYRAILDADSNDLRAHAAIADIAWEQGNWQEAADALMARARLERAPDVLKTLCFRLGLIYADRLVDVPMALKAFQRALAYQPDDENTLIRLADLATQVGEWKLALGACERLVKNETDPDRRAAHLHRVARIFKQGFGDAKRAERALNLALDGAPTNDEALAQLVQFYKEANDITSVRVHLNRVAGAMRARVVLDPLDGVAYRVIARAMSARAAANVPGSTPIARVAAEVADLLGASGEPEQRLLQVSRPVDLSLLVRPEADEVIFTRGVLELRNIFTLLGDRLAKHVGVDLRPYGVTRGDRLRARDNPVAAVAQSVATGLGFGEIDVYISNRQPWVMVAEPTSPVSLVIGSSIAGAGGDTIRFAAGAALKLAQAALAIPARLPTEDLGVLVLALLRLFQPEFPIHDVDPDAVTAQTQKLRRLIPTGVMNDLKLHALAIDGQRFRHTDLARDLKVAGLRAGLVASGSLLAGLRILAAQVGGELPGFLEDPVAQGLVAFALGEDHAVVAR